jgi:hypothetical protein
MADDAIFTEWRQSPFPGTDQKVGFPRKGQMPEGIWPFS